MTILSPFSANAVLVKADIDISDNKINAGIENLRFIFVFFHLKIKFKLHKIPLWNVIKTAA
jgi:hypothetical protein